MKSKKTFDIKKVKYLRGAIKSGMTDEQIIVWMDKNNYTREDLYQIIKILVNLTSK